MPLYKLFIEMLIPQGMLNKAGNEVTLNMLNAPENEVDVEGLHGDVKVEYDGAMEEVTS